MSTTVKGVYRAGVIQLADRPAAPEGAKVLVTFLDEKPKRAPQMIRFGMFAGGRLTTDEDFKAAEWHGEPEIWDAD